MFVTRNARVPAVAGVAAVGLEATKAPFAPRGLWEEDGYRFFQDAVSHGVVRPFFSTYQGYLHTVPRLIGIVAATGPLQAAAVITWLCTLAVTGWCAATIAATSADWFDNQWLGAFVAVGIVMLPSVSFESIASAAFLQFPLLFASIAVLTRRRPDAGRSWNDVAVVVATSLSSGLAILLLPVALGRWVGSGRRRPDPVVIAFIASVSIELVAVVLAFGSRRLHVGAPLSDAFTHFGVYLRSNLFLTSGPGIVRAAFAVLSLGVWLIVIQRAVRALREHSDRTTQRALAILPLIGFGMWAFTSVEGGPRDRYAVVPLLCVLWSLVLVADVALRAASGQRARRRLVVVGLLLLALPPMVAWTPSPHRHSLPSWTAQLARARATCAATDARTAVVIGGPVGASHITIPCARI